jgi:hypothetical protein
MPVQTITTLDKVKSSVVRVDYPKSSIKGIYPFRVRFENLPYPGFSSNNSPGIGLAVIGSTFLIL